MRRLALALLAACAGGAPTPAAAPEPVAPVVVAPPLAAAPSDWSDATHSPEAAPPPEDPRLATLLASCGAPDAALTRVASKLAAAKDAEVEPLLRMVGSPAVRPRVVTVRSATASADAALAAKLASMHHATTRCGAATSGDVTTIVLADFLADLDPLPVRSRTGAWLTLAATLHVAASSAKVIVLGPRGTPKTFPTTIEHGRVHARFPLDRPGGFTVQLLADVAGGPRPVLEARVFADTTPEAADPTAPGENEPTLEKMVVAVRKEESLPPLKRDPRLDALAQAHAEHMRAAGTVAHDLGDGDLAQRFEAESLAAAVVGENVARADTLPLAHRALYASPSHRLNLLNAQYTRVGLAAIQDDLGHLWICEVFSSEMR